MHILEFKLIKLVNGVVLPKLLLSLCLFVSQTLLLISLGAEAYGELMVYLAISIGLSFANFTLHSTYEKFYGTDIESKHSIISAIETVKYYIESF